MYKFFVALPLIILSLFLLLLFPEAESPNIVKFLIFSQIIFIFYLLFLYIAKKFEFNFQKHTKLFIYFIIIGLLIRFFVTFLAGETSYLSDDVYRYIFEGKMIVNYYNPFVISPSDMSSTPLADTTIFPNINHPWNVTIYPPVSQYIFAASYLIGGDSLFGFKLLSLLFELISLFLMYIFIRTYKLPNWTYLIYLFSPLIIIEFLFSNHLDIFGLPFLLGTLILMKNYKNSIYLLSIILAFGVLVKFYILFFLPFIFFHIENKEKLKLIVTFTFTILILYVPFFASSGLDVFGSLLVYLDSWQYNGSLFLLLKYIFSQEIARYICLGIFILAYIPLLTLKRFKHNYMLQSFVIFAVYVIVTPAIFNWYLLWIIPFIIYFRNISFLVLSGTCMLSYHVLIGYYADGAWSQIPLLSVFSYLPFYLILSVEIYNYFKKKKVNYN